MIPIIYSRFDIVWPDDEAEPDDTRAGVDALTYGLSTLVMSPEASDGAETDLELNNRTEQPTNNLDHEGNAIVTDKPSEFRVDNDYAQHIRKLSIGNGPPQFIKDYTADKEAGKMLNTLVSLTIRRCKNLENFSWDMPTGLTRDVWLALANAGQRRDRKLKRLWIRMYDRRLYVYDPWQRPSTAQPPPAPGSALSNGGTNPLLPAPLPPAPPHSPEFQARDKPTSNKNVAFPARTFSLLSPVESLSVLEIDNQVFLNELSTLIKRSIRSLKELRISLAPYLQHKSRDWKEVWEGEDALDAYECFECTLPIRSRKRAGGVLGTLFGRFFSVKDYERALAFTSDKNVSTEPAVIEEQLTKLNDELKTVSVIPLKRSAAGQDVPYEYEIECDRLHLQVLELSNFSISINVLAGVIDWSRLTSLTLLSCPLSDNLWAHLRRQFTPKPPADGSYYVQQTYPLCLRRIRTDNVTPILMKFLVEALAPNSLQGLFLSDKSGRVRAGRVTLKQIFRAPIRRHAKSLQKLTIDSAHRKGNGALDSKNDSSSYQQWLASREMLAFITSGQMPELLELCLSMPYKDWHYFMRRLVRIPHLRVLYIPVLHHDRQMQNCQKSDPVDLAWQVADAVTFRPEIQLAYFANHNRCFEIIERQGPETDDTSDQDSSNDWTMGPPPPAGVEIIEADDDHSNVDDGDDEDGDESNEDTTTDEETEDSEDELARGTDSLAVGDGDDQDRDKTYFDIKEILFHDEKSEVFRARKPAL